MTLHYAANISPINPLTMATALPPPSANASLYSYSTNTSSSTISGAVPQRSVSVRDSLKATNAATPGGAGSNILDRPLNRTRGAEVAQGSWAFMFAEIVAYSQSRVDSVADLEQRWVTCG